MVIKIFGALLLLAALTTIVLLYHIMTQTIWHDIMSEEYEERYEREIERRWKNQDVRIHAQLVITDEMGVKECSNMTHPITDIAHIA